MDTGLNFLYPIYKPIFLISIGKNIAVIKPSDANAKVSYLVIRFSSYIYDMYFIT